MLEKFERETIINFNEEEDTAHIFTYNRSWQRHLEKKLGLKPTSDNGFGGNWYEIDKARIPLPRAKRKLSSKERAARVEALKLAREKKLNGKA